MSQNKFLKSYIHDWELHIKFLFEHKLSIMLLEILQMETTIFPHFFTK